MIKLTLRDSLFLGFCAVLIVVFRMAFRWHLGISGHSMFYTVALLLLARGCVPCRLGASYTGFLAGIMALLLGLGKGGPLIMAKFIFPALVIDLAVFLWPLCLTGFGSVALVAALASATKFFNTVLKDLLVGMDEVLALQHATLEAAAAVLFGVAGSLLVPPVLRKLKSRGTI